MADNQFESAEWKNMEKKYLLVRGNNQHFQDTFMAIYNFVDKRYPSVTFRHVEQKLREMNAVPYLFAEHPSVAKHMRGATPIKMGGQSMTYNLIMNTRPIPRDKMLEEMEPGCWDVEENLKRLETASPGTLDADTENWDSASLKMILRQAAMQDAGVFDVMEQRVIVGLRDLIQRDAEARAIWKTLKIPIEWGNLRLPPPKKSTQKNKV